ncbi:MAG: hypothetical protein QM538_03890 [Methylacidiphilales bacterium]|nr:hypothetical protein [Candidatus Methylacidiphilales bacterium]
MTGRNAAENNAEYLSDKEREGLITSVWSALVDFIKQKPAQERYAEGVAEANEKMINVQRDSINALNKPVLPDQGRFYLHIEKKESDLTNKLELRSTIHAILKFVGIINTYTDFKGANDLQDLMLIIAKDNFLGKAFEYYNAKDTGYYKTIVLFYYDKGILKNSKEYKEIKANIKLEGIEYNRQLLERLKNYYTVNR